MLPFAWKIFIWEMILFTCLYFTNRTHLSPLRGLSKQDVSFSQVAPINTFSVSDDVRIICRWRNGRLLLPCGKHWNGGLNHILIPLSQYCFKGIGCKSLQKYFFSLFVFFFFVCSECGSGDPIWGFPNGSIPNRCMFQPSFLFNKEGIFLEMCRTKLLDFWGSKWPEKRLSFLLQMLWAVWLTKKNQERGWKQTNKKKTLAKKQHMEMQFYFWNLHTASFHWRGIHRILFLKPLWLWEMHGRGGIGDLSVGARWTHPALLLWVPGPAPRAAREEQRETTGLAETPDKNTSIHTWMHLLRLFKSCNFRSTLGPKIWQCIKRKIKLWRFILFPLNSTANIAEALVLLLLIPSIINRLQNLGWFIIILNTVIFAVCLFPIPFHLTWETPSVPKSGFSNRIIAFPVSLAVS